MKTYTLQVRPDENGNLTVQIPADVESRLHEVVIVVHALEEKTTDTDSEIPPAGTGARLAYEAERANIQIPSDNILDGTQLDDMLNDEFGDYLMGRFEDESDNE